MKVLELFAGSRCFGQEAEKMGYNVFSVDWTAYDNINLVKDIGLLELSDIPFVPDFVHLSPDCTTYSIAACSTHRDKSIQPKTEYAIKCDTVNQHVLSLLDKWIEINPKMIFTIENPRGMLRKMPWMQRFKRYTVWYCQYGDDRAKPTDIWTNSLSWQPRPMCFNGNPNCHHERAPRGSKTGTQGRKDSYNRSKIPSELCIEILKSLTKPNLPNLTLFP